MHSTDLIREWISYPEAEQYCGLFCYTIWQHVTNGDIKAARIGRSVRIHLEQDGSWRHCGASSGDPR